MVIKHRGLVKRPTFQNGSPKEKKGFSTLFLTLQMNQYGMTFIQLKQIMNDGPSPIEPSNIKQIVKEDGVFN